MKRINILFLLLLTIISACQKTDFKRVNKTNSGIVKNESNYIVLNTQFLDFAEVEDLTYGHCLSLFSDQDIDSSSVITIHYNNTRACVFDTLNSIINGNTYYYRPYVKNANEITYGEQAYFIPQINTNIIEFSDIQTTTLAFDKLSFTCHLGGTGSFLIQSYGYEYRNVTHNSTWSSVVLNGMYPNNYSDTLINIAPGDDYELKIFIQPQNHDKVYSQIIGFSIEKLVVNTGGFLVLGSTSVRIYGEIIQGALPISNYGFCYSNTTSQPDLNSQLISLGTSPDVNFQADVNSLQTNITYYYRAFGVEENRITYGEVKTFIIPD